MHKGIVILDFGSQYSQIIARRIREINIESIVIPYFTSIQNIQKFNPCGIILSGSPASIVEKNAFFIDKEIYNLGIPILGICYGMHLIIHSFGGKILNQGKSSEYGKSLLTVKNNSILFQNIPKSSVVWMSHSDEVALLPKNFQIIGNSTFSSIAAIQNEEKKIYALQFHPEVSHSEFGILILKNFSFKICHAPQNWILKDVIAHKIEEIRQKVGTKKVILGFSGGIDSSVAAALIYQAIGNQLICIFVNTGLLRKNEENKIVQLFKSFFKCKIRIVNASDQFLNHLIGIHDPEKKRKQIGNDFIEVFYEEANKIKDIKFLGQGTIYTDIIESTSMKEMSSFIKSHHNVGGLPKNLKFELLEPLKNCFKDEVQKIGLKLGLPYELLYRHPFPGPGLGIRILGEVSKQKIKILQQADDIFIQELHINKLYYTTSQSFIILLPIKSVGVMGDKRTYQYTAVIRSINTIDFMTATWSKFSYEFLEKVSNRIINEVIGINRVVYDISSKPPATIEWE